MGAFDVGPIPMRADRDQVESLDRMKMLAKPATRAGTASQGERQKLEPSMVREMRRPSVDLLPWEKAEGSGYPRSCVLCRELERHLTPVVRQHQAVGDRAFADCSGKRVRIVDPATGVAEGSRDLRSRAGRLEHRPAGQPA